MMESLPTRRLGKDGAEITRVGFGAWAIGGAVGRSAGVVRTMLRRSPRCQPPEVERNLALRDALRPIAERHGTTVAAVAVAWTLSWPGVTGAIVGARSPEQVDGWIGAATLELTGEDLDEIARAIERTGAGAGPIRP